MTKDQYFKSNRFLLRSPSVQLLLTKAIEGKVSKSEFLDEWLLLPRATRHKRYKGKKKTENRRNINYAYREATNLEELFGWLWRDPTLII